MLKAVADQAAAESAYCFEKWGARAITRKNNATKATGMHSPPPVRSLTATSTHINPYSSTTAIISRYHLIPTTLFTYGYAPPTYPFIGRFSALDLDAVVQATQHLSSKLNLSELLTSLMDLIVTNTGASRVRDRALDHSPHHELRMFFFTHFVSSTCRERCC